MGSSDKIEVLCESERTRIYRKRLAGEDASVIVKRPLGASAEARLSHERKILQRLAGIEGVPRMIDLASDSEELYLEDCGKSLAKTAPSQAPEMGALLVLAVRVAEVLVKVHLRGVIHKDINPSNILLSTLDRKPTLIDFDLAATFDEEQPGFIHPEEIAGTLAYIAPEQTGRTGRSVDRRSDLYSLGATLYELLTGRPPFEESDPLQLVYDHLTRVPVPPFERNPRIPRALSDIVMRLLEKEPDKRYQSAEGLAYDLACASKAFKRGSHESIVLGERDFPLQLKGPSRPVGREAEIEQLRVAFENCFHRDCRGVLVRGAPGVGKTQLVNELRSLVIARHGWFVSGKFDQYQRDLSSDAITQAFRGLAGMLLAEPEANIATLRGRIHQALGQSCALFCSLSPEFSVLLEVPDEAPVDDPFNIERRLVEAGVSVLRAVVSPERPVVWFIDNLQWAAPTPIRFLDAVLNDPGIRGLLIVAAFRETEPDHANPLSATLAQWEQLEKISSSIKLHNLSLLELSDLLSQTLRLPRDQTHELAAAVAERTDGNPFDTLEFLDALRSEGVLAQQNGSWRWDVTRIRHFMGKGDVVGLLSSRIGKLPSSARLLIEIMVCLGGEVELGLMQAASNLSRSELENQLMPALEDGLLMWEQNTCLRFRHDRVEQVAYDLLLPSRRTRFHLSLARRFAELDGFESVAATQYLHCTKFIHDPQECRKVAELLRRVATPLRNYNFPLAERLLAGAVRILAKAADPTNDRLLAEVETDRHAALYNLGRLNEADAVYRSIERRSKDPMDLVDATCVQLNSLVHRGLSKQALELGILRLRQLPVDIAELDPKKDLAADLQEFNNWIESLDETAELARPEAADPQVLAAAQLLHPMAAAAVHADHAPLAGLLLRASRLWKSHGRSPSLVLMLSHAGLLCSAMIDEPARHRVMRFLLDVSEESGYEPATAHARLLYSVTCLHWKAPFEDVLEQSTKARENLLKGCESRAAGYTYVLNTTILFFCGARIEEFLSEADAGIALAEKTANDSCKWPLFSYKQLARALRGETDEPGSFSDASFAENPFLAGTQTYDLLTPQFHLVRATLAAIFGVSSDHPEHAAQALASVREFPALHVAAVAHFLHALALAGLARTSSPQERDALLEELDVSRNWLVIRAVHAPENYLHLVQFIDAERAWATGDCMNAIAAFDAANCELERNVRPWQKAMITEHSGLFRLSIGLDFAGRSLLAKARDLYSEWGATAKALQMERTHAFLRAIPEQTKGRNARTSVVIRPDSIDLLAVLRASQALSSETNLGRLNAQVSEFLGAMTGATSVLLLIWHEDAHNWFLSCPESEDAEPVSIEQAAAMGLLPLSAFRYAERVRQPLLVEDATQDDRFSSDPYIACLEHCSLLVVPISSQGVTNAFLLLENRLSHGAFSADRLDTVSLIAGQLAVSLNNARLYASLEQKVAKRTADLAYERDLLRTLMNYSPDLIYFKDLQSRFIKCSTAMSNRFGLADAEDVVGKCDFDFYSEEHARPAFEDEQEIIRTGLPIIGKIEKETWIDSEKITWAFTTKAPLRDPEGNIVGTFGTTKDITEIKEAEINLELVHKQLVEASRQAGMAEIATNVLHNVGNVLNSVNVSVEMVNKKVRECRIAGFTNAMQLMKEHSKNLGQFLTEDPKGQQLPGYLEMLSDALVSQQESIVEELAGLTTSVGHIKEIVSTQQSYAHSSSMVGPVQLRELIEDALRMNRAALARHDVELVMELADTPVLILDKHRILLILVNLVSNAKYAMDEVFDRRHQITLRVEFDPECSLRISVTDNGVGIAPENLTRIFTHGFTTRKDGHGFGLHSCALAAKEMDALLSVKSDGRHMGAVFTLEIPLATGAKNV